MKKSSQHLLLDRAYSIRKINISAYCKILFYDSNASNACNSARDYPIAEIKISVSREKRGSLPMQAKNSMLKNAA